jgi:hypothetical protein
MKKILIIIVALSLSACATIRNPITTNQLATVESAYGIALSIAVAYRNTRLCKRNEVPTFSNICAQRSVLLKLQVADRNVQIALAKARLFIRDNPTLDAYDLIQGAQIALDAFKAIEQQHGIGG